MICRFGVFAFDDQTKELRNSGRAVALEPQPAKALRLLLSRPGEAIAFLEENGRVTQPTLADPNVMLTAKRSQAGS
jgi:DNA-binding response OmpR family regulator